jgi:hypothetical protein
MDQMFAVLLCWQFIFFALGISAIVFVIKTVVEYIISNHTSAPKESKLWNKVILPILPIVAGALLALIAKKYPYPEDLPSISGRVAFGLVAGMSATIIYQVFNATLANKIAPIMSTVITVFTNRTTSNSTETLEVLAEKAKTTINKE